MSGSGDDSGGMLDEALPEPRMPSHLLLDGTVFRVAFPADGSDPVASVDSLATAEAHPFMFGHIRHRAVMLLEIDDLVIRAIRNLGLPVEFVR